MNTEESTPLRSYPYTRETFDAFFGWCKHIPIQEEQKKRIKDMEEDFGVLIGRLLESTPPSPEQTLAMRRLQEAAFYAKKAICQEK